MDIVQDVLESIPQPFIVGLRFGGLTIIVLIILHRLLTYITPVNKKVERIPATLPLVANVKHRPSNKETVSVVVGGSGFLGRHITHQLLERGDKVRVVDLVKGYEPNVEYIVASILDEDKLTEAFRDARVVFHTASILEFNRFPLAYDINVVGTRHVINACLRAGVTRLVYTSSIAVVMDGKDVKNAKESTLTYTKTHLTPYGTTKAIAEIMVIRSNGTNGLRTVALRPPGLYGPGDLYFTKQLMVQNQPIISGPVIQDFMYIENTAHAHILASDALTDGSPVPGNFYYIGDEPKNCLEFCRRITRQLGMRDQFAIPKYLGYVMATIIEAIFLFGGGYFTHLAFSMNLGIMRTSHLNFHASTAKAQQDFGFKSLYSTQESIDRTVDFLRTLMAKDNKKENKKAIKKDDDNNKPEVKQEIKQVNVNQDKKQEKQQDKKQDKKQGKKQKKK